MGCGFAQFPSHGYNRAYDNPNLAGGKGGGTGRRLSEQLVVRSCQRRQYAQQQ